MNALIRLGKYFFLVPFLAFGLMHLMKANDMAGMVPLPGGAFWVYLTGVAQLAFVVSVLMGKYDKLAALLTFLMLIIFVVLVHAKGMGSSDQGAAMMAMTSILKDLGLAGGALMYAQYASRDNSIIG